MLVLGTADVLGTDDLLGTADVERCSRQSAHRLQLESSVYSGPKKRSDGQVAAWALPAPNTDAPPTRDPVGQAAPVGGPDGHCRMAGAAGLWRRRGGHSQAPDLAHQPE